MVWIAGTLFVVFIFWFILSGCECDELTCECEYNVLGFVKKKSPRSDSPV